MTALNSSEIVVGLDVGSTKVSAVVGEVDAEGITILGVGNVPCRGLRKGVVSNIEWTVRAIREAISAAQTMAGVEIGTVYLGLGGAHVRSQGSEGVAAISGREVMPIDVERVLEGARAVPVDTDRMILHALPREFIVDNQDGVRDPIGMSGVRLQARVNLVTGASASVQNAQRCVERCDIEVADVALAALASADAVLSDDEKEIGVAVIDIGGGTTDIIQYLEGAIVYASVLPVGGNNVTNDVAAGLRTPMAEAERLKRNSGCALGRMVASEEEIEVPGVGGHAPRKVPRKVLSDIIEPRVEEIFTEVRHRMEENGLIEAMCAGVVLTGGGVLLEGMVEAAEEVLGMPVRLGYPSGVRGFTQLVQGPQYAAGVGLVRYGAQRLAELDASAEYSDYEETSAVIPHVASKRTFWTWVKEAF